MAETPRSGPADPAGRTDCTDCTGKFATLDWIHWYNHRLLEPIAYWSYPDSVDSEGLGFHAASWSLLSKGIGDC